jgi:hypothetical protein
MDTTRTPPHTSAAPLAVVEADPLESTIAALVRESHDADMRRRIDDSMDRHLARFMSRRTRRQSLVAA